MFSRPLAVAAEKITTSKVLEFTSTTAGIFTQIAVTSYMSSRFGGNEDTTTNTATSSERENESSHIPEKSPRIEPTSTSHPENDDEPAYSQRFGRTS